MIIQTVDNASGQCVQKGHLLSIAGDVCQPFFIHL